MTNQLKEIGIVSDAFTIEDFNSNTPLTGEFLLGYHCQRQKIREEAAENQKRFKDKNDKTETPPQGETE